MSNTNRIYLAKFDYTVHSETDPPETYYYYIYIQNDVLYMYNAYGHLWKYTEGGKKYMPLFGMTMDHEDSVNFYHNMECLFESDDEDIKIAQEMGISLNSYFYDKYNTLYYALLRENNLDIILK